MSSRPYRILAILFTSVSLLASVPAPVPAQAPTLTSFTLDPTSAIGGVKYIWGYSPWGAVGYPVRGTITLSGPAPNGGAAFDLSSTDSKVVTFQSHDWVEVGKSTRALIVTTHPVASTTTVTITASYGGVTKTATLTVWPPELASVTLNAPSITGGTAATGTVTLSGPAPADGFAVGIHSTNTAVATGPAVATIPAGQTTTTFTVATNPVASPTHVFISGSHQGVIKNVSLGVVPPQGTQLQQAPPQGPQQAVPLQKALPQPVPARPAR